MAYYFISVSVFTGAGPCFASRLFPTSRPARTFSLAVSRPVPLRRPWSAPLLSARAFPVDFPHSTSQRRNRARACARGCRNRG
jgi:hypothetical protein